MTGRLLKTRRASSGLRIELADLERKTEAAAEEREGLFRRVVGTDSELQGRETG